MKKLLYIFIIFLVGVGAVSCNKIKKATDVDSTSNEEANSDSAIYGICAPKSNNDSLLLVDENGDTITFYLFPESVDSIEAAETNILGGVIPGNRLAVMSYKDAEGRNIGKTVINISTMMGRWTNDLDRDFSFEEDGSIQSYQKDDTHPFRQWRIRNGHLIIDNTEYTIDELDSKKLSIEDTTGIYEFERRKTND